VIRVAMRKFLMVILLAAPFHAPSLAQAPAGAPSAAASSAYVLGADDEIEITVFGQKDMSNKTRIRSDGTITLPYLDSIQAAGRTTAQLSALIANRYKQGGILAAPSINVEITNYASRTVTILGSVPNAGLYALDKPYSVAAIVAKAGGIRPDGANVVVLTPANGQPPLRIALTDMSGAAGRRVEPGDNLFVPRAELIYVYGPVSKPGSYSYTPGMTYRQALGQAGGPTVAGSSRKIEVRRGGKKISASIDDPADPEDVLIIKEKFF
jgi:polysaccharide biosynthesis/export protein